MEETKSYDETTPEEINIEDAFREDKGDAGSGNLNAITLYSYPTTFLLEPSKSTPITSLLLIDKKTGRMKELSPSDNIPTNYNWKTPYSAFLGILHIAEKVFMVLADRVTPVCKLLNNDIYTISSTTLIPFGDYDSEWKTPSGKSTLKYIFGLRKLLRRGYYFSYSYDLTLSKQKMSEKCPTQPRFQWNKFILKDVIKAQISNQWQLPLIQGYIGYFETKIMDRPLNYYLISRRSCYKAGTRFTVRGLDDEGNVANFVETEQIIVVNGGCFSNIQLRGSAPVFWQQTGVTAQIKITRNFDFTNNAFLKHIQDINNNWGRIICLNLMSRTKTGEQSITTAFEDHIKKNDLPSTRYEFFDFHQEVKGQRFDKVNPKIESLKNIIQRFGFYSENLSTGAVQSTQLGAIRTNCLDCLDRTNFFQSKIAMSSFDAIMQNMKADLSKVFGQDPLYELDDPQSPHHFIVSFKNVWALNADLISVHYAGTGSVISGVTKTGKRTFMGFIDHGMKTINRFYVGNFEDQFKQKTIDLLLGQHTDVSNAFEEDNYEQTILEREKEFVEFQDLSIFAVTWNMAGNLPALNLDLSNLFDFKNNPNPDLVIINLQEYIALNATNVVVGANQGDSKISVWREIVGSNLQKFDDYVFVRSQQLVGILMLVFARNKIKHRINRVESDLVKTGLGGNFGNKGATVIKMYVDDTSFCFINCHLESGNKSNSTRVSNIVDIHEKAFQQEGVGRRRDQKIGDLDYRFLIGDMNWRLDYGNYETREALNECTKLGASKRIDEAIKILETLLKYDQFVLAKGMDPRVNAYQEGKIMFLPTYKYDEGCNRYDTSKKQRIPSWTDRIMWSCGNRKIKQLFYSRKEFFESDHRPVTSYFIVETKKIDKIKKESIISQIHSNGSYTITQETTEIVNPGESNQFDPDQYFDDPDSNPQQGWITENNSETQVSQSQSNASEINLLDDIGQLSITNSNGNGNNQPSFNKQNSFSNNPFSSNNNTNNPPSFNQQNSFSNNPFNSNNNTNNNTTWNNPFNKPASNQIDLL